MKYLVEAGYRVIPQWKLGSRIIDLVVEGKRLAIECYGDRDLPLEQLDEDMDRQAIVDRLGWTFARVGSLFFRAPDRAMMPILEKLRLLDIPTKGTGSSGTQASSYLDELTAGIICPAGELRFVSP
jgi:very-short-patch-repair endonuclease